MSQLIKLLFGWIIFFLPSQSWAEDVNIRFAGFAFRGDVIQIQRNYPYTYKISQERLTDERGVLDAVLWEKIKDLNLKNAQFRQTQLAKLGDGSLTLACSLDTELISIEQYTDGFKIVINLGAQALLFDFGTMQLVGSYPIMIELVDFVQTEPDVAIINNRVRDLLLSGYYGINLFDEFAGILSQIEFKKSYNSAIKVTEVIVERKAMEDLPEFFTQDIENFKTFVAQTFGKYLSRNQNVSILPYTKGGDIGKTMALCFSDANVFELAIPDPQFAAQITVRGFKKVCTEEKTAGASWVYGAYTNIKIIQPALGKSYIDERFQYAISKIIPADQKTVQDWPIYQNSLVALFNDATKQFSENRKFRGVHKMLETCR
jgi:hypothetical protein